MQQNESTVSIHISPPREPPIYLLLVSIFVDHGGMKPEISTKRKTGKLNTWKLVNCLEQPMAQRRNERDNKSSWRQMEMEMQHTRIYGISKNCSKREVYTQ